MRNWLRFFEATRYQLMAGLFGLIAAALCSVNLWGLDAHVSATSGNFVKIYDTNEQLKETWAHLFTLGLNSGKSEAGLFKAFPKGMAKKFSKMGNQVPKPGELFAEQMGEFVIIRAGTSRHLLQVVDTFPNLVLTLDDQVGVFHMRNKKLLNRELTAWKKALSKTKTASAGQGFHGLEGLFSMMEQSAVAANSTATAFLAGMGGGLVSTSLAAITAGGSSAYGNVTVDLQEDPQRTAAIEGMSDSLSSMAKSLQEMTDIQKQLGSLKIRQALGEIAQSDDKTNPAFAKDMAHRLADADQQDFGAGYARLIDQLRDQMHAETATIGQCELRKKDPSADDVQKPFMSVQSQDAPSFNEQRKAMPSNLDEDDIQVGDLVVKTLMEPANPISGVSPNNEKVAAMRVCRNTSSSQCSDLPENQWSSVKSPNKQLLSDYLSQEVRAKALPKLDTSGLNDYLSVLAHKLSDQTSGAKACAEHSTLTGADGPLNGKKIDAFLTSFGQSKGRKSGCDGDMTDRDSDDAPAFQDALTQYTSDKSVDHWIQRQSGYYFFIWDNCKQAYYAYLDSLKPAQLDEIRKVDKQNDFRSGYNKNIQSCETEMQGLETTILQRQSILSLQSSAKEYTRTLSLTTDPSQNQAAYLKLLKAYQSAKHLLLGEKVPVRVDVDDYDKVATDPSSIRHETNSIDPDEKSKLANPPDSVLTALRDIGDKLNTTNVSLLRASELRSTAEGQTICCESDYCKGKLENVMKAVGEEQNFNANPPAHE